LSILTEQGDLVNPYRSFIAKSRYSRWIEEEGRRETWTETVDRYVKFMRNTDAGKKVSKQDWAEIREAILFDDVMPSMRGLMTAGPALERENLAQFNCSFIAIDDVRAFDEALYILMNGVGLGFSVEAQYVAQLPTVNEHFETTRTTIVVQDSKAGWARAFRELLAMLYAGQIPIIDVTKVRPAGARLKTFGGRASGPQPLVDLFDFTIGIFKEAAGRKLSPLECHDIMCKVGDVVVVGGVRRSALISQSDLGDYEMAKAKSGAWWEKTGYRRLANNSAVYYKKPSVGQFLGEWSNLIESDSGERGIINMEAFRNSPYSPRRDMSKIQGLNPCGEILLRSKELCNLTEVVITAEDTLETLEKKVRIATILGTIQSSLTNFKYLRKIWRDNCEEERLLGVSLTGQFGNRLMSGQEGLAVLSSTLDRLREVAIDVNAVYAKRLGINVSVAITTGKPSGTVSQKTGTSSGMHAWYDWFYLRTVRADNKDPMTAFLKDIGIPWEPDVMAPETTTVFTFPQAAPEGAVTRNDITAVEHLEIWKVYKIHWTEHNPSITINVKDHEWIEVANWVYENWQYVGGISFLPYDSGAYKQAPYQTITESEYHEWVARMPEFIDWAWLSDYEHEDTTSGSQTLACSAGNCEVVSVGSVEEQVQVETATSTAQAIEPKVLTNA
jgi:ribonucleoside-triphosphate reductase